MVFAPCVGCVRDSTIWPRWDASWGVASARWRVSCARGCRRSERAALHFEGFGTNWLSCERAFCTKEPGLAPPLALAVAALPRAAYVGETAESRGIVIAVSEDSGLNAAELLRTVLGGEGGKGGGSARLAEGILPQGVAFEEALATIGLGK